VPNNREIAALIWMLVVVLLAARSQTIRSSAKQVAAQALQPAIAVPFLLVIGYIGAVVLGAAQLGIWTEDLLSETVLWGLGPGVGLLFSALEVSKGKRSVRQIARRAVGLTVAIEFFVNLYVFSLPVELLLVPLLTCAVLMSTVAGGRPEHAAVKRLLDGLLGAAGLGLMIYVAIRLGSDLGTVEGEALLRTLALPIWLTLVTIPFAFVFGSFLAYERALSIVDFMSDGRYRRWQTARALVLGLRFDLTAVSAFRGNWARELGQAASSSIAGCRPKGRDRRAESPRSVCRRLRNRRQWRAARPARVSGDAPCSSDACYGPDGLVPKPRRPLPRGTGRRARYVVHPRRAADGAWHQGLRLGRWRRLVGVAPHHHRLVLCNRRCRPARRMSRAVAVRRT
jgi:hypothetical protein